MSATVTRLIPVAPVDFAALRDAARDSFQGSLALDVRSPLGLPQTPEYDDELTSRASTISDTAVRIWAARFGQAVQEAIGGERPLSQLVRWTNRRVYQDLARRVQLVQLARPVGRPRAIRPQVRSVHVFLVRADAAEISIHIRNGERSRCIAARAERDHRDERWICTALELG